VVGEVELSKLALPSQCYFHSKIVVAFRDCLHFNDNTFEKSNDKKAFPSQLYGKTPDLQDLNWSLP
jgi:hypothetical protein